MQVNWPLLAGEIGVAVLIVAGIIIGINFLTSEAPVPTQPEITSAEQIEVEDSNPEPVVEIVEEVEERDAFSTRAQITEDDLVLSLRDISFEPRSGFAKVTGIWFNVYNEGNSTEQLSLSIYIFDDNDEFFARSTVRAKIPLSRLDADEEFDRTAALDVSVNEIDVPKTIRMVIVEEIDSSSRDIASLEYVVNISEELS